MIFTSLFLDDEDLYEKIASFPQKRTYLSGPLTIFDTDDLILPTHIDRYDYDYFTTRKQYCLCAVDCYYSWGSVEVVGGLLCEWEFIS